MASKDIDRDTEIFKALVLGNRYSEIAIVHGISPDRVRQICMSIYKQIYWSILRKEPITAPERDGHKQLVSYFRATSDFWITKADELKEHYKIE